MLNQHNLTPTFIASNKLIPTELCPEQNTGIQSPAPLTIPDHFRSALQAVEKL